MGKPALKNLGHSKFSFSAALCVLGPLALSACTSSSADKAVPKDSADAALETKQPLSVGAPTIEKINARGGTKIAVLVNGQPITSTDISRRANFVRLRRMPGNRTTVARNELIDEAIKLQEARRIGVVASQSQVDASYARFAKGNKMSLSQLGQIMTRSGTTVRGFKNFLKAQISWQRAVATRVRIDASGRNANKPISPSWLPEKGSSAGRENEYILQQVVFTVPTKDRRAKLAGTRAQAKNFRNKMVGCSNARQLASGLTNVAVIDRGRVMDTSLPRDWVKDIQGAKPGSVTRVRDTPRGVEMIAICNTREVIASRTAEEVKLFSGNNFQKAASATEKKYFAELKEKAKIVRR